MWRVDDLCLVGLRRSLVGISAAVVAGLVPATSVYTAPALPASHPSMARLRVSPQ
jgi:hypothetical protein